MLHYHKAFCSAFGMLSLSLALGQVPQLTVRMYNLAPVPPGILDSAGVEAARILRGLPVRLSWINCSAQAHPAFCETPEMPTGIRIRLLPKALLEASGSALGIAMWSESGGSAALFYDRAISLRKPGLFLPQILGRAMAHEIVHLLLGTTSHAELGLMRGAWSADDLRPDSGACLELTPAAAAAIRKEAQRRVAAERAAGPFSYETK